MSVEKVLARQVRDFQQKVGMALLRRVRKLTMRLLSTIDRFLYVFKMHERSYLATTILNLFLFILSLLGLPW